MRVKSTETAVTDTVFTTALTGRGVETTSTRVSGKTIFARVEDHASTTTTTCMSVNGRLASDMAMESSLCAGSTDTRESGVTTSEKVKACSSQRAIQNSLDASSRTRNTVRAAMSSQTAPFSKRCGNSELWYPKHCVRTKLTRRSFCTSLIYIRTISNHAIARRPSLLLRTRNRLHFQRRTDLWQTKKSLIYYSRREPTSKIGIRMTFSIG